MSDDDIIANYQIVVKENGSICVFGVTSRPNNPLYVSDLDDAFDTIKKQYKIDMDADLD